MKKSKKILVCVMAILTLGSLTIFPLDTNAVVPKDDDSIDYTWYEENVVTEAVLIVEDGEYSATYYYSSQQGIIKIDDTFDTSNVDKIINISPSNDALGNSFIIDEGAYYTRVSYDFSTHDWLAEGSVIEKPTIGESSEPNEETLQRGDINGDGKINVLDLLQLKKYILKIIDTLE